MVSMAFFMGIIKGKNGVYKARKKVPRGYEEKAAIAAGSERPRLSWLTRSRGTKDRKEGEVRDRVQEKTRYCYNKSCVLSSCLTRITTLNTKEC
jgi:hypothetical protein